MRYQLGISAYVSTFDQHLAFYEQFVGRDTIVFTSMHIAEEFDNNFEKRAFKMLDWFKDKGFYLIVDLSPRALAYLGLASLDEFVERFAIDNIRLDFGFSAEDITSMQKMPDITFNASQQELFHQLNTLGFAGKSFMMHNFYPRPETGIDVAFFKELNQQLLALGQEPIAFISGNMVRRGPLFAGLPTLERHRHLSPYVQFVEMAKLYDVHYIFIGDSQIDQLNLGLIQQFMADDIISLPVAFETGYEALYDMTFTIRPDSPANLLRLVESRDYVPSEAWIANRLQKARPYGAITLDNHLYQRYAGEIQILKTNLPKDERVNVIGAVDKDYLGLLACIKRESQVRFIRK